MTPPEMQLLLQDVEQAQRQLTNIASRLKLALNGYQTASREPYQRPPSSDAARDRGQSPDMAKLAAFRCPKCKAEMRWQWSKLNGEWFAGCSNFTTQNCRGSRPYDKVMGTEGMTEVINGEDVTDRRPPGANPPWADEVETSRRLSDAPVVPPYTMDDVERVKKHHGEDATGDIGPHPFIDKIPF